MNIDANKIIERYAESNKELQFKNYLLEEQVAELQKELNEYKNAKEENDS